MLRPAGNIFGIEFLKALDLDAFFVLPLGAITGALVMGKGHRLTDYVNKGITRMAPVVLMLLGAGALSGLIINSVLPDLLIIAMDKLGLPVLFLAPISGAIMGATTSSIATGVIIAGSSFSEILLSQGVPALSAAILIHAGAAVLDVMPHGNYFLASMDCMKVSMVDRLKVLPFEALVGAVMTIAAIIIYSRY